MSATDGGLTPFVAPAPRDYVGLLFCGQRRAEAWRAALAAAGVTAKVTETFGEESTDGAYKVSVPRRDLPTANALVTAVTRGEVRLADARTPWLVVVAVIAIAALVVSSLLLPR